jgi:uncharacterized protein YaaW (UPF0174 family)
MNDTSSNSSYEDAPLLNLLNQPLSAMSTEELRAHVQDLREVSSNVVTLKKSLTKEKAEAKPATAKAKADSAALLNKYLQKGQ